jgi:hypothetical protein
MQAPYKPVWQSRTFWSAVTAGVSGLLSIWGVEPKLTQSVTAVFGVLAVVFARDAIEQSRVALEESPEEAIDRMLKGPNL